MTVIEEATPLAQDARFGRVRHHLGGSRLVASGGVLRTRLLNPAGLRALVQDALEARPHALEARVAPAPLDQRGDPDRWLDSATGGPALQAFAGSGHVLSTLTRATNVMWQPAGPASWSFYQRAGHHLGLHRDLAVCDLAVITCVVDEGAKTNPGGVLQVWPSRPRASLQEIRLDPAGAHDVRVAPGESLLLLGGFLAHRLLPLGPGHIRIVAPVCYQAVRCVPDHAPNER